ncbi:unnamed protein product [Eruca vesicaria subsp. sativa]|uniref:C2H2-type domain-containing protein n=1 Tax=Eruca vesicaria subsp. sativa TaxID=29727 RepID=A0ABC8KVT2_ERUVS|nr:unnamed protein product [Eruca vesicaria subsp. sativa]
MSQSLHVCKICGKGYATVQAVCGHQRAHSKLKRVRGGLKKPPRVCTGPLQRGCKATCSLSLKESSSSFMSEIEKQEMDEAAVSLVMFSEGVSENRNLPQGVDQWRKEFSEVSATCSDVVAQALSPPLRSKSQIKRESNFSYRFKICGKSFERSLGSHQALHRSDRGQDGHLLSVLTDSGAKKIVPQPSCIGVSQEELIERGDTNVKEHSVEARQGFSKVSSHSSFEKSSCYSDVVAQEALLIPLGSKLQEKPKSKSSYKCKVCGKIFGCFQALGGHQTLHRPINVVMGRKRKRFEDGSSPSGSSEAKKIVSQPSSYEVSKEELIELRDTNVKEHSVELKQDFQQFSTCGDVLAQALPSPLRCNTQKRLQS